MGTPLHPIYTPRQELARRKRTGQTKTFADHMAEVSNEELERLADNLLFNHDAHRSTTFEMDKHFTHVLPSRPVPEDLQEFYRAVRREMLVRCDHVPLFEETTQRYVTMPPTVKLKRVADSIQSGGSVSLADLQAAWRAA